MDMLSWPWVLFTFNDLIIIKGLRLKQFFATRSPLKKMKNCFYTTLKTVFVLKILKFLSYCFGHVEKQLD